jgi:dipeptidyl aminopeptidase/acylaminoacyl peptidase
MTMDFDPAFPSRVRIALFGLVVAATSLTALAADPTPRVPVAPFFRHADYSSFKLSPSGKYVAGIIPVNGRGGLVAIDLETRKPGHVTTVNVSDIGWFEWVNDDRLVFTVLDLEVGSGEQRGSGLFTVKRDGSEFRVLVRPPTGAGQWVYRYTQFLAALHDGSDDILVVANDTHERYPDVYRLNTDTGRKTLRSLGKPGDVVRWVVDREGAVRAAVTEEKEGSGRVYWRPAESAPWEKIDDFRPHRQQIVPVGFDGDGSLIIASRSGRDTLALYRFDAEKKARGELLAAHPQVDLASGLIYDYGKKRVVGVAYNADRPGVAWFDEDWARVAAMIDRALPGHFNVLSRSEGPRALVFSYSDTDPGSYFLLDIDKRKLENLVETRRAIKADAMPARQPLRYTARDGLEIPAWLTLPKGKEAKNLPLVVLVHGGPWVHGAGWRWSGEAAFLGSLGYAVLEPEFRGSTGWGWKHYRAGFKQWGRAMQDDLDDGMDWLVQKGTVDAKRVCIMGASYGGYAVMMGLARDPDRWRCGINAVGVTDINLMYDVAWSDFSDSTFMKYVAKDMLGDQVADAAQLKATSPLEQAARVRAPVLMAYGGNDRRVPLVHGEKMRDALSARDVPVEWVVYSGEGHGFLLEANRFDFYTRVARFLDVHLRALP